MRNFVIFLTGLVVLFSFGVSFARPLNCSSYCTPSGICTYTCY